VIEILIGVRRYAYLALSPLDRVSRAVNEKSDFPPLHLRRYVGPLRSFEASGAEFMVYLKLLAGLRPQDTILDVGCGCGLMAIFLKDYLAEGGSYTGVDIHKPSVRWCAKNIGTKSPSFRFEHIDVINRAFNPKGTRAAEDYSFPFAEHTFDVILLKSVFTHMRPPEMENYLKEISRLLKPNGRCLATFFLLNEEQAKLAAEGKQKLDFRHGEGPWRYVYEQRPESAVAYEEGYVRDALRKCGLTLQEPIHYGTWSGRRDALSFQDMLVVRGDRVARGTPKTLP
jgi:SAM-dependent methyltransferase